MPKNKIIKEEALVIANRKIILQQYGEDDYAYYDEFYDCSVRGTYDEIMKELSELKE